MPLPLVILGSARSNGETRRAVDLAFPPGTAELVVLPNFSIGGYDYQHFNANDAFGHIAPKMAEADSIVFATPVYWYAMSAPLKIFFDRLTDMTENLKALGKSSQGQVRLGDRHRHGKCVAGRLRGTLRPHRRILRHDLSRLCLSLHRHRPRTAGGHGSRAGAVR